MGAGAAALIEQWPVKVPIHRGVSSSFMAACMNRCFISFVFFGSLFEPSCFLTMFEPFQCFRKCFNSKSVI